jgi:hypothetical protein
VEELPAQSVLWHLMAHGIAGTTSAAEERALEFLANPLVNRRVFGQPLPQTVGYYFEDYCCIILASDRFTRRHRSAVG